MDMIKASLGSLSDATLLGTDPALVGQAFQLQAQQIVDGAGLVGRAFDNLLQIFPDLTGVVQESTTEIKRLSDETKKFYDDLAITLTGYLDNLRGGTSSTLSPQDRLSAAQSAYDRQLGLAQSGDRTALGSITQYSDMLLSAAKDFFASGAGFQSIFAGVTSQLTTLPGTAQINDPVV